MIKQNSRGQVRCLEFEVPRQLAGWWTVVVNMDHVLCDEHVNCILVPLADPGGAASAPPPKQDQFFSFLHTFLPKSVCVRGQHPPQWVSTPPTENPGSATGIVPCHKNICLLSVGLNNCQSAILPVFLGTWNFGSLR